MHTQCTSTQYVTVPLNLWREIVDTCTIGVEYSNNARSVLINTLCALNGKDTLQVWQHEDTEGSAMTNINEHLRGGQPRGLRRNVYIRPSGDVMAHKEVCFGGSAAGRLASGRPVNGDIGGGD